MTILSNLLGGRSTLILPADPWRYVRNRTRVQNVRTSGWKGVAVIGALILGLFAGFIGRALVPNDVFSDLSGPTSWAVSVILGLAGAFVGYLIFTRGLGIGDDDAFDLGGILSAIIGVVIVLVVAGFVLSRMGGRRPSTS
jgi:uncharacterized membrane protein YeaQ/YmgE (transglycosylase-associated protein family)